MKLYTRTGDSGETSLSDGSRISKGSVRVTACGDIDELSACLGWCRAAHGPQVIAGRIPGVQRELSAIAGELATPADTNAPARVPFITEEPCRRIEAWIDEGAANAGSLKAFILPGGTELACRLHLARTCCRRAERSVVILAQSSPVRAEVISYLNRLGDLLFTWARQANHEAAVPEVLSG